MYRTDLGDGIIVEWNGSATFNVFVNDENVDCFTNYHATPDNWQSLAMGYFVVND